MPFQFYCPQGHLLEGHETQMGQQSQCPYCGSVFTIPVIGAAPMAHPGWMPGYQPSPPGFPGTLPGTGYPGMPAAPGYPGLVPGQVAYPGQPAPGAWAAGYQQPGADQGVTAVPTETFPDVTGGVPAGFPQTQTQPAATPPSEAVAGEPPAEAKSEPEPEKKEPRIVRIPCPQGHELQTPMDMVNQDVLCPICNTQFHLRYEDSIEFKEERAELRRLKEEKLNKAALKWSIIAAAVVMLSIVGMVIYHEWQKEPEPPPTVPASEAAPAETGPSSDTSGAPAEPDANPQE